MKHVISFEESRIVYVGGNRTKEGVAIHSRDSKNLPEGTVKHGLIMNPEAVTAVLTELVAEQGLRGKKVTILLSTNTVTFRELTLPTTANERELRGMVNNEMLYYAAGSTDYTAEYMVLEKNIPENKIRVLAFALPGRTIELYLEQLAAVNLECDGIDISSNALGKLTQLCYPAVTLSILLNVNGGTIDLRLVEDGFCVLSRNIRLNLAGFLELGTMDIAVEEVADHVNRVLQFSQARHRQQEVERLLLLGDFPQQQEFLQLLAARIGKPCTQFILCDTITVADKTEVAADLFAKALGGILRRK